MDFRMREKTNITLHPEVKKAAQTLAEGQQRSLSELVERLLEREVERHGQAPRFYMGEQAAGYAQQPAYNTPAAQG
jgi:predicted transcriptional regulator